MNTEPKCKICNDTGSRPGSDFLDCTACDAATERAELDLLCAHQLPPEIVSREDLHWFIHQRAREIERQASAALVTALKAARELLANTDGLSKNNIDNLAGELVSVIDATLAGAPAAPAPTTAQQEPVAPVAEEWSYSTNEENYQEQEPSRMAILHHVLSEMEDDFVGSFWIGRNVRFVGQGDADTVIDQLREQAYEECGEYSETYLDDVTAEEKKELEAFISGWAARVDRSNFWTVTDVEHHTVESAREAIAAMSSPSNCPDNEGGGNG